MTEPEADHGRTASAPLQRPPTGAVLLPLGAFALLVTWSLLLFGIAHADSASGSGYWIEISACAACGLSFLSLLQYWLLFVNRLPRRSDAALEQAVEIRTRELRLFSRHLMAVREQEQTRVVRELHDGLGSNLTAVAMDLSWARQRLQDQAPVATRLARAHSVLSSTVDMKRRIIDDLRPTILDNLGLSAAIESHVGEISRRTGIALEMDLADALPVLPDEAAPIELFRIFQEALNNAVRHARAAHIRVVLRHDAGALVIEIADDGIGIGNQPAAAGPAHYGLMEMHERALLIGATMWIRPAENGRGTVVRTTLPLAVAARNRA
jgi:signal transduction histidine kinase